MTEEQARCVQAGDIVYRYETAWLVVAIDDRTEYNKTGRHFLIRLGASGNKGHEQWGFWKDYDLTPHK